MSGRAPGFAERSRSFILPVEIKNRELDAMLLLGCELAERGQEVVVGDRKRLKRSVHELPRGIYLGKTVTSEVADYYRYLGQLGHTVAALDEEGLVIYSPEIYVRRRVSPGTMRLPAALLAWGESNAAIWRDCLDGDTRTIFVTGNPRLDLDRPELRVIYRPEARAIQERYGDYVLFNSNFQWVNTLKSEGRRLPDPDEVEAGRVVAPPNYDAALARYRIATFRAYLELLPRLAEGLPSLSFVIRPHPGEDRRAWEEAVRGRDNCHVVYEQASTPWVLGAKALLHHSCTTAVEAFVLDRPVLAYRPFSHDEFDPELPIRLSDQAATPEAVLDYLRALDDGQEGAERAVRRAYLAGHAAALEGRLATERIADLLMELPLAPGPALRQRLAAAYRIRRKRVNRLFKPRPAAEDLRWRRHLFPETPVAELAERVGRISRARGRYDGLRVTELSTGIYRLARAA